MRVSTGIVGIVGVYAACAGEAPRRGGTMAAGGTGRAPEAADGRWTSESAAAKHGAPTLASKPAPPPNVEDATTLAFVRAPNASTETVAATGDAEAGPVCPTYGVWIPATLAQGFVMSKGLPSEHRVVLRRGFCVDATEVTVRAYAACVAAGACKEPWRGDPYSMYPDKPDHPVNLVSWTKARAYCAWAAERLPTEAEWEWAATGPEQSKYPWGDEPEPSCEYVDYTRYGATKWLVGAGVGCGGGPSLVGSHPKGDKVWPGGRVHDLAGNVWEWVEDSYLPLAREAQVDPVVRAGSTQHVIRGGGWNRSYAAMVVTYRGAADVDYEVPALGFRCVTGGGGEGRGT